MAKAKRAPKTPLFLDNGQSSFEKAKIIATPIPFEGAISYMSGAALGPKAILEASSQVELFDFEHDIDLSTTPIHTVAIPKIKNLASMRKFVSGVVEKVDTDRQFYLGIGGDHTVTIPTIETLAEKFPNFGIVQFDAHADLRDTLHGNKYSHACIMRRNA